jgi:tetratricopeptide (TPR) repeat protein
MGNPGFNCKGGDLYKLKQAQAALEDVFLSAEGIVSLSEGLQNGIHLNLGHTYFWLGYCDADLERRNPAWSVAQSHYLAVLDIYRKSIHQDNLSSAIAHAFLGYMLIISNPLDHELSLGQFDAALTLLLQDRDEQAVKYAIELMPVVLSLQCQTNQWAFARERLDAFVNAMSNSQSIRNKILSNIPPQTTEVCKLWTGN